MSKRITAPESLGIYLHAVAELDEVRREDGPRNAALFARIANTARRFTQHRHADLVADAAEAETAPLPLEDALERVGNAFRVADSYRVVYGVALTELNTADPRSIDYAHRAAAQYTAALEQLTGAVSDARVALYAMLPVVPA